jgi:hypothetical protein
MGAKPLKRRKIEKEWGEEMNAILKLIIIIIIIKCSLK